MIMFTANTAPATAASRRSRRLRDPNRRCSANASAPRIGSAYAQRHSAAAAGETDAFATRMAVNAIVSAPSTPASAGRSLTAGSRRCRRGGSRAARRRGRSRRSAADRNTVSMPLSSAISTSAPVTAPPRPWRRTAGSVATPTISATSPTGRSVPIATGPAGGLGHDDHALAACAAAARMCSDERRVERDRVALRRAPPARARCPARRSRPRRPPARRRARRRRRRAAAASTVRRLRRAPQRPVEHEQRHLEHVEPGLADRADQRRRGLVHPLERLGLAELAQPGAGGFDRRRP